jgi:hypothetical protein
MIFHSDDFGNTGAHLLALLQWDKILLDVVSREPMFLKLKNDNDDFIFNLTVGRIDTFLKILEIKGLTF